MSDDDWDVVPIGDPGELSDDPRLTGKQLRMDDKAFYVDESVPSHAAFRPSEPQLASHAQRQGILGTQMDATKSLPPGTKAPKPQPHEKPMTHEQLMAMAQKMMADTQAQKEAQMANPSLGERDAAGNLLPAWLVKQGY